MMGMTRDVSILPHVHRRGLPGFHGKVKLFLVCPHKMLLIFDPPIAVRLLERIEFVKNGLGCLQIARWKQEIQ